MKTIIFLTLATCYLTLMAHAQGQAGTSGFAFLKLGQSVRAASLGGSFVALADDPSAIFYNPAGLQLSGYSRFSFTQTNYLIDSSYSTICYTRPMGLNDSFGFAVSNLSFGSIQETTSTSRNGTGRFFTPGSILGVFSWARDTRWAYLGVNAKFMQQNIDSFQENGMGIDAGILTRTPLENLRLGASILNLETFLFGVDYEMNGGLTLVGDVRIPRDASATLHLGTEYRLMPFLTLRGGVNTRDEEGSGGNYSLGLGFNFLNFNLDYAFVPYAELGDTHRAALTWRF